MTTVRNLNDPDRIVIFSLPPREAVIAAHAHSMRDGATWDYEKRYGSKVVKTLHGWNLGDWWARDARSLSENK